MNIQAAAAKIDGLLELQRKVVGIKLVKTKKEYCKHEAVELKKPLAYCVAVKCAMSGYSIRLSQKTGGCIGSNRALGLTEPTPQFFDGTRGCKMGLFKDKKIASSVAASIPICPADTYGIIIKPIELFEDNPDVVLIVALPRTMMRILQGYTYNYGLAEGMHMSGNQAVCVECTATPMNTGSINVSMFCSGTRYRAGWKDTESMIGIPFNKFYGTVHGIENTVNAVECDDRKKKIENNLRLSNNLEIEIQYGKTYYKKQK